MPARKNGADNDAPRGEPLESHDDDNTTFKFVKDEIVWAKMKFFSAWPAKVSN